VVEKKIAKWYIVDKQFGNFSSRLLLALNKDPTVRQDGFRPDNNLPWNHRHLKIIDCLTARVFFISIVNGCSKKKKRSLL
jgi:hypothetical protein